MTVLIIFAIIFVLAPIAQAYARRLNPPELPPGADPRELARLREELDQLAAQVARLQEEQSFMVRLLSEGEARRLERGERHRSPSPLADEETDGVTS